MPTKRPRVTLTETPVVARRLQMAAARFPERAASRADLLLLLTEIAERALAQQDGGDDAREAAKSRLRTRTQAIAPDAAQAILAAREADWRHEL